MTKINIMDWERTKTEIEVNLDDVLVFNVSVITGDEVLRIVHKDGKIDVYDSSNCRCGNYHDGEYSIFPNTEEFNRWLERRDSYEWIW